MERRKSQESNAVISTVEGISVILSNSQERNPVVRTVSYAEIMRRNIPPR